MKLLNYTSAYFAGILLIIITIWAVIFYYVMLREIYDSIDDGLDNQKGLVIQKAARDSSVLHKKDFDETDYAISEIPAAHAIKLRDVYTDTMMYMQNEKSNEPVRLLTTTFLQNNKYYQLKVATSMVEEDDLIKQLFYSILWLYIGLVISIILFNNFLLKRVWRPFYHLLKQLRHFRLDKPQAVTDARTGVEEFRLLQQTIQKLLKKNIDAYTNQKQFIENAAHELQTPLAISINKLETLVESEVLPEKELKLVAATLDNLDRLSRLNKSLLLLSRIENQQFGAATPVNIGDLTRKGVEDFADQLSYNGITVELIEEGPCIYIMNADLAVILITNLIKNAIIHNKPGGMVIIILKVDSFIIQNSGNGTGLVPEKVFDRFYTGNSSNSSTGLGLQLLKRSAVCTASN